MEHVVNKLVASRTKMEHELIEVLQRVRGRVRVRAGDLVD